MPNRSDTQPEDRLQVICTTVLLDAAQEAAEEFANSPDAPWQSNHSSTWVDPEAAFIAGAAWQASLNNSPLDRGAGMTYDVRDTMIASLMRLCVIGDSTRYDERSMDKEEAEVVTDTALSVIANHLANEPRTKAETALIEFAEGKAKDMRDNGFLHASDRAIPREISQAFVEELK